MCTEQRAPDRAERLVPPATQAPPELQRRWLLATFGGVLVLHLSLLAYFAPPKVMFSDKPIFPIDYALHYYQVDRALKAFDSAGRLWGYDPHALAGQPAGAIEDLSSKSLELFVLALRGLGVPSGMAFNLYVLLVHLLVPFAAFLSARLFGLRRSHAVVVALLWVLMWFFDSFFHWIWYCGMISWAATAQLVVLMVALLYRMLLPLDPRWDRAAPPAPVPRPPRSYHWAALVLLAAAMMLIHPFSLVALLLPGLAIYLRHARALKLQHQLGLWAAVAAALATTLLWLLPALALRHYIMDSTSFLKPTPDYILWDWLDLMLDSIETGAPVRTMLRMSCFVCAGVCLWYWRRQKDRRLLPLAVLIVAGLFWAYFGGLFWITKQMQPHRHIAPAMFAAAIPAAVVLGELFSRRGLRLLGLRARLLLVLLLIIAVPRFVRTALYYFPEALPLTSTDLPGVLALGNLPSGLVGLNEPRPYRMGHAPAPRMFEKVRRWLQKNHNGRGRIVVQSYELGEYLAGSSSLPVLGGLAERNVPHVDAHLFRLDEDGVLPDDGLERYFERYAVGFLVMSTIKKKLEWRKDLLKFRVLIDGIRVYETRTQPSYFMRGSGRVVEQAFNRIVVDVDRPADEIILRFHWMETLRCRPNCRIERQTVEGDRVGFIRVANPPARLEVYNSYRF